MQLLVSVRDAAEAADALAGGADIIDAKDPSTGALGIVSLPTFRTICAAIAGRAPVSAALGDAPDPETVSHLAAAFASAGATFVKVGVLTGTNAQATVHVLRAAVAGAADGTRTGVVAAGFADRATPRSLFTLVECAASAGAAGVLLDTADKHGPGLCALLSRPALAAWVRAAADAGLRVTLAGRLTADDVLSLMDVGAEIAGVRGAVCDGGRRGRLSAAKVRALKRRMAAPAASGAQNAMTSIG